MSNRLKDARSPYLRKAADQPVDWHEWGDEAFEKARREDRPIFLSIGGVWCHWCHVMAHESFDNEEIAGILNSHFVPVKVDRDERPDIDRRYQDVVLSIAGSGGWPLTVFLTPEGKAFFGGTYFPPDDKWGKAGLKQLLGKIIDLYSQKREEIFGLAENLYRQSLSFSSQDMKSDVDEGLIEKAVGKCLSSVDYDHGGFGSAPKFHHAMAYEFLLNYNYFAKDERIARAVGVSLDGMVRGGIYDHLAGAFFRYSTDEKWIVPHFEKMLADNAELLKVYSIAYQVTGNELYRYAAEGIVDYYRQFGMDDKGGFAASQDADIGVLDEGGYYTFSLNEVKPLLTGAELEVMRLHLDIDEQGEMHHDTSKNVLYMRRSAEEVSAKLQVPVKTVGDLISSAKDKLRKYREEREMPYIDSTIYTNWNSLMIEALCRAGIVFGTSEYHDMARKTADLLLREFYKDGAVLHCEGVEGLSEDYIFFAKGLLALFEVTQDATYLDVSVRLIDRAIELFWDGDNWGFFDTTRRDRGYLTIPIRNIQDTPNESVNGIAPLILLTVGTLTGDMTYIDYAGKNLQAFSQLTAEYPTATHSYFVSLLAYLRGMYKVETSRFFDEALRDFRPYKFVLRKDVPGVVVCEKDTCRTFESYPGKP